jgi:hypothetical protein
VSENEASRKIFRPNREEKIEQFMMLYKEKLSDLYKLSSTVRIDKIQEATMVWACSWNGKTMNEYRIFVDKPLGERQLGRVITLGVLH